MSRKQSALVVLPLVAACLFVAGRRIFAQPPDARVVRIAELTIDPNQLHEYKAALAEEIAASIAGEPGVLTLFAVSVKDHPDQVRLFEVYRDAAAYQAHLRSPHFLTYKQRTQQTVRSLTLLETEPILLGSKSK